MPIDLLPTLSYVLISTFTPGPANITSASTGMLHGYRKALRLQLGLATGLLAVMLLSGWVSSTLLGAFPALEPLLRYAGAAYVLYLAYGLFRASYAFTGSDVRPLGFRHGLLLQMVNPKLMVYAFTLFSTFLAPLTGNVLLLALAATLLAAAGFGSTSVWALFGAGIKALLQNPRLKVAVNAALSLSLVYVALALVGVV